MPRDEFLDRAAPEPPASAEQFASAVQFRSGAVDYQAISAWNTPSEIDATSANTLRSKSMTRPAINGPRSATKHVVDFPVATFVTRTTVPNGNVRCAHVPAL